ncbi:MAG: sigma-70 family RNA polymerase sigma factor, partial [Methyloligellaceae bacterium]
MEHHRDDKELLQRIASGDQTAVRALYARHNLRIFRFILRMTGSETTAEDITNDVFMEIWRNAGRFEGRSAPSTWMFSIARNRTISFLRKRSEAQLDDDYAASIADDADSPETTATKSDKGAQIKLCIDKLSEEHREIIELVYYHEKSVAEVAEVVG